MRLPICLPMFLACTFPAIGQTQNAVDFDGLDDEVLVPNASTLIMDQTSFSLACRVYPTQNANWPNMEAFAGFRDNAACDFYLLQTYGTTMEGRFRNSSNVIFTLDSAGILQLNVWQFVALTYDGSTLNMYHNNALIGSMPANGTITTGVEMFRIGNMPIPGSFQIFLDGRVDEVGLWKRALSPDEIGCLVGGAADLTDPDLVLYYGCDQGTPGGDNTSISTLTDAMGNLDGNLVGFAMNGASSNFVAGAGTGSSLSFNTCPDVGYPYNGDLLGAGTHTFTYTSQSGCDSIVTVTISEIPVNTSVNQNGTTLISLNGGASWQWMDCDNGYTPIPGATFQTYTPQINGSYAVEVTDNGCTDTSACYTVTSIGLSESSSPLDVHLLSTSVSGTLTVVTDGINGPVDLSVIDSKGRMVLQQRMPASPLIRSDVAALRAGFYQLLLTSAGQRAVLRFIKP